MDAARQLRALAAEAMMRRLRHHEELAEPGLRPIFAHIRENVFSSTLNVDALLASAGAEGHGLRTRFQDLVLRTPRQYIEAFRMEVAANLLRLAPELRTKDLTYLVGYESTSTFHSAFKRYIGCTPGEFPDRSAADLVPAALPPPKAHASAEKPRRTEEAVGTAEPDDIETRYIEEFLWPRLLVASPEERLDLVNNGYRFRDPAAFREILRWSQEDFRDDRRQGVEVAGAVLDALAMLPPGEMREEDLSLLRVEALIAYGNALRMAEDLAAAEDAFAAAELEVTCQQLPPWLEAKWHLSRGLSRSYLKRFTEARDLLDLGLERAIVAAVPEWVVKLRIAKGLALLYSGALPAALEEYEEARRLLEDTGAPEPHLRGAVYSHLARAHLEQGDLAKAKRCLDRANVEIEKLGNLGDLSRLAWLQAMIDRAEGNTGDAQKHFQKARDGLLEVGERAAAAVLALELALLAFAAGRPEEAERLAHAALPDLGKWLLEGEALGTLKRLRKVLERNELQAEDLLALRAELEPSFPSLCQR